MNNYYALLTGNFLVKLIRKVKDSILRTKGL